MKEQEPQLAFAFFFKKLFSIMKEKQKNCPSNTFTSSINSESLWQTAALSKVQQLKEEVSVLL